VPIPSTFASPFKDHLELRLNEIDNTQNTYYKVDLTEFDEKKADEEQRANLQEDEKMFRQAQVNTFSLARKQQLSALTEVEFESGDLPVLRLSFVRFQKKGGTDYDCFRIRFLDDLARERWRRCLALVLRGHSDHTVRWDRHWTQSPAA